MTTSVRWASSRPQSKASSAALSAGCDVIIWPGGEVDSMRSWRKRDQVVLAGHKGFVRQAMRSGVPIVPVASVGGSDTAFVLSEGHWLANGLDRFTGLKKKLRGTTLPIMLGFPFGLTIETIPTHIPLPAKIRTELLDPIHVDHDPETAQRQRLRELDLPRSRDSDPGCDEPARQAAAVPDLRLSRWAAGQSSPPNIVSLEPGLQSTHSTRGIGLRHGALDSDTATAPRMESVAASGARSSEPPAVLASRSGWWCDPRARHGSGPLWVRE